MLKVCQIPFLLVTVSLVTSASSRFINECSRNSDINKTVSNNKQQSTKHDDALFLTQYIQNGQIQQAQALATVTPFIKGIESFSGYLTVNKSTGSNLFFWLFKSQQGNWEQRPLVIWLQGGPGGSGITGLFTELGPFSVTKDLKLKPRQYSWHQKYNLVFFDQPVGTGFSFTKVDSGYATNQNDVSRDLYEAIVQLYKLFPGFQKNKLIITGESYAGKYIPAIAYRISKLNKVSSFKINLAGCMIGNGLVDPINMLDHASYLYTLGLVDKQTRDELIKKQEETLAYIRAGQFGAANKNNDAELDEIMKITGLKGFFNFVEDTVGQEGPEVEFIKQPKIKQALHVGTHDFSDGMLTHKHLDADILQSVKPWVEELLTAQEFPILFYSGQLDIMDAYALSIEFYQTMQWPYAKQYHSAKRCQFKVGGEVAGYYKTAGSFTEVLIRNAAHLVPTSQPKWAFELVDRFITNSDSFKCE